LHVVNITNVSSVSVSNAKIKITILKNFYEKKKGFAEVLKNLTKYRSENNFVEPSK